MRRIYLDQWVWVALAKAAAERPDGRAYTQTLEIAQYGADHSFVAFPLSPAHYLELTVGANPRQRRLVGGLMYRLSRGHRMIGPNQHLLAAEFDAALRSRFGVPEVPRSVKVFGLGVAHAFSFGPIRLVIGPEDRSTARRLPPHLRHIEDEALEQLERGVLEGFAESEIPQAMRDRHRAINDSFVEFERSQRTRFLETGFPKDRWHDALLAREWRDLLEPLEDALNNAGLSIDWFLDQGRDLLTSFLEDLPTVHACLEMRRLQHENPQRDWRPSDQVDVHALAMATVYCDVLVTEKHWAHMIRRARLDKRYGTTVLDRIQDLDGHIV